MPENVNSPVAEGDQGQGSPMVEPESIDTSNLPDEMPTEDVKGLKSAFEKIKSQLQEYKTKATAVDLITKNGYDPSQLPQLLDDIKKQEQTAAEIDKIKAEAKAQYERELAEKTAQYQRQVNEYRSQAEEIQREQAYRDLYSKTGGKMSDFNDFYTLAPRFTKYNPETRQIEEFYEADGKTVFYTDDKEQGVIKANSESFVNAVKQGKYGAALAALMPAYNLSSGVGIPEGISSGSEQVLELPRSMMNEYLADDKKRALVKAGKVKFKDY